MPEGRPSILELKEINTFYGGAHILHGISLHISAGEVVSLLGRNGAGKTTLANIIANELGSNLKITSGPVLDLSLIHISEPTRPY